MKDVPDYDSAKDYYKLYWIAFLENQILLEELKKKSEERNDHLKSMMKMQASIPSQSNDEERQNQRK